MVLSGRWPPAGCISPGCWPEYRVIAAELSPAQEIGLPQDSVRRFVWGHVIPSREEHGCKLLRKPQVLNNSLGIQTCQETREAGPWGAAAGIARAVTSQPLNLPVIET